MQPAVDLSALRTHHIATLDEPSTAEVTKLLPACQYILQL